MPSNPRKHKSRAILHHHTRRIAEQACEYVLETWELPRASGSQPTCGGHGGDDHACTPAPDLATAHVTGFVADEMRGPMESGAMADANTEGDGATGGAITYSRGNVQRIVCQRFDRTDSGPLTVSVHRPHGIRVPRCTRIFFRPPGRNVSPHCANPHYTCNRPKV